MQPNSDQVQVDPKDVPQGASAKTQTQFALAQQHQAAVAEHRRRHSRGAGNAFAISVCEVALAWLCFDMGSAFWAGVAMFFSGMFFLLGLIRVAVANGIELDYADPPIPPGLTEIE